jgi:hypothetical protein
MRTSTLMSTSIEAVLTMEENQDLERLESIVERGLQSAYSSLLEIRDKRLYRSTHGSFEDYCLDRFGISRRRAYQLIDAAKVAQAVCTTGTHEVANERQARALVGLPEEQQREAWEKACEAAGDSSPTAKQVQDAVLEVTGAKPKSTTNDTPKATPLIDPSDSAEDLAAQEALQRTSPDADEPETEEEDEPDDDPVDDIEEDPEPVVAATSTAPKQPQAPQPSNGYHLSTSDPLLEDEEALELRAENFEKAANKARSHLAMVAENIASYDREIFRWKTEQKRKLANSYKAMRDNANKVIKYLEGKT